jgi:hypothetical protein
MDIWKITARRNFPPTPSISKGWSGAILGLAIATIAQHRPSEHDRGREGAELRLLVRGLRDHPLGAFLGKPEPQIILKTDKRKVLLELGL